jgi:hypothetical protein
MTLRGTSIATLLVVLMASPARAQSPAPAGGAPAEAAPAADGADRTDGPRRAPAAAGSEPAAETFVPSERVPADRAVRFPVDI